VGGAAEAVSFALSLFFLLLVRGRTCENTYSSRPPKPEKHCPIVSVRFPTSLARPPRDLVQSSSTCLI
jgi:hypothetical protein